MDEIIMTRQSLLNMQVCTTIKSKKEVTRKVNAQFPCGTSLGWMLVKKKDNLMPKGHTNPVQCEDHPDRLHFLFLC